MAVAHAQGRRVQLQVEQLEDRLVPSRFGRDILVNTTTALTQDGARVAVAPNGDFVVTWTSGIDNDDSDVFARRFNAKGKPQGGEFQVNTTTENHQQATSIAMDAQGNFMIVWGHSIPFADEVRAQWFDALGNPFGGELTLLQNAYSATIAMKANGDFALAWNVSFGFGVQFFDAQGQPQGPASLAPGTVDFRRAYTGIEMDAEGNCLVLWGTYQLQGGLPVANYFVRSFDATGQLVGDIGVPGVHANATGYSTLAVKPNGTYLVVWERDNASRHMRNLWGRLFHASGEPRGPKFHISQYPSRHQPMISDASFAKDGSFVVTWTRMRSYIGYQQVMMRHFDAQGRPLTDELQLGRLNAVYSTVAAQPSGTFVLAWSGNGVPFDIHARRFFPAAPPTAAGSPLASMAPANLPWQSLDEHFAKSADDRPLDARLEE